MSICTRENEYSNLKNRIISRCTGAAEGVGVKLGIHNEWGGVPFGQFNHCGVLSAFGPSTSHLHPGYSPDIVPFYHFHAAGE